MKQAYLASFFPKGHPVRLHPRLAESLARLGCSEHSHGGSLQLFASADLPLRLLPKDEGFVIGHLFEASGVPAGRSVEADLTRGGAEVIISQKWGSYVALARIGDRILALRDPSGGLACYHLEVDGVHYLTSVPHLLVDCGLVAADVDWSVIATLLIRHRERAQSTALRQIREVLPGNLFSCDWKSGASRQMWNPWREAGRPPAGDHAERLEQVLCASLGAWARSTDHPLVEVSGGLDSAIVAAGVAAEAPRASLITFAAAPGDPDETAYARSLAKHLGLELEIVAPRLEDVDLTRSLAANLPRPNARAFTQAADAASMRHGRAIGADAFVSGGGGDDVFCYLRTILPALDRLQAEGGRAMIATAMDIATMTHATFWEAISRIARRLIQGAPSQAREDLRLIRPDASLDHHSSKAQESISNAVPGKADHIRGVVSIHNDLEGHARAEFAPILSPLLSQPIVECCLSIPTWLWCEGGRNRAVARQAFTSRLPEILVERRSKGAFDGFCARLLQTNRTLVGDMLLDGRLADQGLLDREAVAEALRNPSPPADIVARLLRLADVETWVASWSSRPGHCP